MRDAHDTLGPQGNNEPPKSTGQPKAAPADGTAPPAGGKTKRPADGDAEKNRRDNRDSKLTTAVPVQAPPVPALPLSLGLALLAADAAAAASATQAAPQTGTQTGDPQPGTQAGDPNAPSTDAVQPDPAASTPAVASGQPSPTELSFALKLTPPDNAAPAPEAAGNDPAGPIKLTQGPATGTIEISARETATLVTAVKEAQKTEMQPDEAQPAARVEALVRTVAATQTVETAAPSGPQTEAHPSAAAAMKTMDAMPAQMQALDQTPKPAGPMKDLSIQVGQTQTDRVEVRVVERAGELQVAVHAANPEVAQGLRQGLSDLSDRLEQNGFRAEAWRPGSSVTGVQGMGETRQRSAEFQNDGSPSQQGGSRQGQQQQSQQQGQRPRWVQELEGSLTTSSTGDSYGIPR